MAIALTTLISACASLVKAREKSLREISIGQSKAEVIQILGEPDKKATRAGEERWSYKIVSEDQLRYLPYTAVFEGETLTNFYFDTARDERNRHGSSAADQGLQIHGPWHRP